MGQDGEVCLCVVLESLGGVGHCMTLSTGGAVAQCAALRPVPAKRTDPQLDIATFPSFGLPPFAIGPKS